MVHSQLKKFVLPAILGSLAMPVMAADYTYTDSHGSIYNLTIGSNIDGGSLSFDEYLVTLVVDTTANDLLV